MNTDSTPLLDNQYVRELISILDKNGKDSSGLNALLNHVDEMEAFVKHAENKIAEMKEQLDSIKEIQDHPVKAALQNAIRSLEKIVERIKTRIETLKNSIAEGCKNAVTAFRDAGVSALDNLATFFDVKGELQDIRLNIDAAVRADDRAIAKIEEFSKEYHSAGRAFKNMARLIIGKKPIDAAKESGKLAMAVSAPYKTHKFIVLSMRKHVNKAITRLENLQARAWARKAVRAADKQPSIMDRLQKNLAVVDEAKREHRLQERVAAKGAEL